MTKIERHKLNIVDYLMIFFFIVFFGIDVTILVADYLTRSPEYAQGE
jgi:energy-coupling factor transporter transmembrane protein EcfT